MKCAHKKRGGVPCKGDAIEGSKYCGYHDRKVAAVSDASRTHGLRSKAETLGVPAGERLTFDEFHSLNKPFELTTELAYLRTILVEMRKALESQRDTSRDLFLEDLHERSTQLLLEANMKPAVVEKLVGALHPVWVDIIEAYYGPAEPLQPEQFQMLADMIEKISRVAEKAKKIQEGITLNVEFKNVGPILVRFVREILFAEIHDPMPSARELRQNIVARVRSMNLTGQSVRALQGDVVDITDVQQD